MGGIPRIRPRLRRIQRTASSPRRPAAVFRCCHVRSQQQLKSGGLLLARSLPCHYASGLDSGSSKASVWEVSPTSQAARQRKKILQKDLTNCNACARIDRMTYTEAITPPPQPHTLITDLHPTIGMLQMPTEKSHKTRWQLR